MTAIENIFRNMPPAVKNLLIINVIVWLFMALVPAADAVLTRHLALYYFSSPGFGLYQLFTYMFLHSGFTHLFFNMFALVVFGSLVERAMGTPRFLLFYFSCGVGAALVQMGVFAIAIHHYSSMLPAAEVHEIISRGWSIMRDGMQYTHPVAAALNSYVNTPMVGASGAIYGVILAFGMLFPNMPMYLMFIPVPIKAKWLVVGYAVLELMLGVGASADGVAHFAHLGGMIFGLMMIIYWRRKGVFRNHWFF